MVRKRNAMQKWKDETQADGRQINWIIKYQLSFYLSIAAIIAGFSVFYFLLNQITSRCGLLLLLVIYYLYIILFITVTYLSHDNYSEANRECI